ncbi:MAG TPA: hypothetical protein VGM86_08800 [Thermoanaerobaculia bacterium]
MQRKRIDLRFLPVWLQYVISCTVVLGVALTAWWVGRDRPIPLWVSGRLLPAIGWIVIALAAFGLAARFLARRK